MRAFIDGARRTGLRDGYNFDTDDLFEGKNMRQVVLAIMSLARLAYTLADYKGPCMGKPEKVNEGNMASISSKAEGLWGKTGGEYKAADNKNLGH